MHSWKAASLCLCFSLPLAKKIFFAFEKLRIPGLHFKGRNEDMATEGTFPSYPVMLALDLIIGKFSERKIFWKENLVNSCEAFSPRTEKYLRKGRTNIWAWVITVLFSRPTSSNFSLPNILCEKETCCAGKEWGHGCRRDQGQQGNWCKRILTHPGLPLFPFCWMWHFPLAPHSKNSAANFMLRALILCNLSLAAPPSSLPVRARTPSGTAETYGEGGKDRRQMSKLAGGCLDDFCPCLDSLLPPCSALPTMSTNWDHQQSGLSSLAFCICLKSKEALRMSGILTISWRRRWKPPSRISSSWR